MVPQLDLLVVHVPSTPMVLCVAGMDQEVLRHRGNHLKPVGRVGLRQEGLWVAQ